MNPNNSENVGKGALTIVFVALAVAAKKYGPIVAEKAKEVVPALIKIVLRRG